MMLAVSEMKKYNFRVYDWTASEICIEICDVSLKTKCGNNAAQMVVHFEGAILIIMCSWLK